MTEQQREALAIEITKLFIPLDVPDTLGSINFAQKAAEVMELLELGTANVPDGGEPSPAGSKP
jgi:hypothetical protein